MILIFAALNNEVFELIATNLIVMVDIDNLEQLVRSEVLGSTKILPDLLNIGLVLGNSKQEHVEQFEPLLVMLPALSLVILDPYPLLL